MRPKDFQLLLLPLLESIKDGEEHSLEHIQTALIRYVELSDKDLVPFVPDVNDSLFNGSISIAMNHLINAGLLVQSKDDCCKITSLGKMVLSKRPNLLDIDFLRRLPGYKNE